MNKFQPIKHPASAVSNRNFVPIIGLEVHVELATKSKMFCGCPAEHFGVNPNSHTCPVCLGLPGALPVPNKKAIDWTILLGLALGCKINLESKFDRKNYFYPDLPKGYQITQYDEPFCVDGKLSLGHSGGRRPIESIKKDPIASLQDDEKIIRIRRVHLEEDTGKLQHERVKGQQVTLVDFNRSGVPLVEIVTEPDFRSIEEVDVYLKNLQKIIRYLGISNADMEKGSMRLEPSISLSLDGSLPKYRVELKNINSFRYVKKALEYEIERQQKEPHILQTRGWDDVKNHTYAQREKEEAHDYRYFPEPDIPPIHLTEFEIRNLKFEIPELPLEKSVRFQKEYGMSEYQANILTGDRIIADDFEEKVKSLKLTPVEIANIIINKRSFDIKENLVVDDKKLNEIVDTVLQKNSKAVADYKAGKLQVLGFLIGATLREIKADRKQIEDFLKAKLQ